MCWRKENKNLNVERFRVEREFAQGSLCVEFERVNVMLPPLFIVVQIPQTVLG